MQIERFSIDGPFAFTNTRFADERGYFEETFNSTKLQAEGLPQLQWMQDNESHSILPYTLRGLHFQLQPMAQAKIIRVLQGRIFDVAVNLIPGSAHFAQWVAVELSRENAKVFYVPEGFAHGFLTLEPNTRVAYKASNTYSKVQERCLSWRDTEINIDWPLPKGVSPIVSEKDGTGSNLSKLMPELC